MKNQPLTSNNSSKLFIFFLLMVFSLILFLAGLLPTLILIFGLIMMKRTGDFSNLIIAVQNFTWSIYITIIAIAIYIMIEQSERVFAAFIIISIFAVPVYIYSVKNLFLKPLMEHEEWVVENWPYRRKDKEGLKKDLLFEMTDKSNFSQSTAADELTKWARLKEDGFINQNEYDEIRKKILLRV